MSLQPAAQGGTDGLCLQIEIGVLHSPVTTLPGGGGGRGNSCLVQDPSRKPHTGQVREQPYSPPPHVHVLASDSARSKSPLTQLPECHEAEWSPGCPYYDCAHGREAMT